VITVACCTPLERKRTIADDKPTRSRDGAAESGKHVSGEFRSRKRPRVSEAASGHGRLASVNSTLTLTGIPMKKCHCGEQF
jgi:hypothetical protein